MLQNVAYCLTSTEVCWGPSFKEMILRSLVESNNFKRFPLHVDFLISPLNESVGNLQNHFYRSLDFQMFQ